ncbi:MAG: archaeosortase A [Candidatus Methanoperedens sp.]|nr:archaeosortase A [Candidatus Methanoperedens sp.]
MAVTLWIALGLLAAASVLPKAYNSRFLSGSSGWIFLSIYWFMQPPSYIEIQDYFNAFLVVAAAIFALFIAYITFQARNNEEGGHEVLISLSRAASVGGLIYFLFVDVEFLNIGIISLVTNQTIWIVEQLGYPVAQVAWNQLAVGGLLPIEIILACTAIESIALFMGLISSATKATLSQKFKAFMISVPVIYSLNLLRTSLTASAYGLAWFGTPDESFHITEHFIAKIGSLAALFVISYTILKMLPEVTDMIDDIFKLLKIEFRKLARLN